MVQQLEARTVVADLERCLACRSCEFACALAHAGFDDPVEAIVSGANLVPRVRVVAAEGKAVPIQCQQCEDAPCAAVCPSGALSLDPESGSLRAEPARCIGCKACVLVCPFGAVRYDRATAMVVRCDLCDGIIAEGEEPRCVSACPTGARRVVDVREVARRRQQEAARRTVMLFRAEHQESGD